MRTTTGFIEVSRIKIKSCFQKGALNLFFNFLFIARSDESSPKFLGLFVQIVGSEGF